MLRMKLWLSAKTCIKSIRYQVSLKKTDIYNSAFIYRRLLYGGYHMNIFNNNASSLADERTALPIDAVIHVSISANKLESYVNIEPPINGGAAPTLKALEDELVRYSITYGIDKNKLGEISENPKYNYNIIIARGAAAINATDGTFKLNTNSNLKYSIYPVSMCNA